MGKHGNWMRFFLAKKAAPFFLNFWFALQTILIIKQLFNHH